MAFGSSPKKRENYSASTMGYKMFNSDSNFDKTMIKYDFWGQLLTIKIHPELPTNRQQQSGTKFDYENEFKIFLTKKKSRILADAAERYIIPALKGEINMSECEEVGVTTNSGYIGIGNGSKYGCGPYIILHIFDKEANDMKPVSSIGYEFNNNNAVKNYDPNTGSFEEFLTGSELYEFIDLLRETDRAFTFANAHSTKEAMEYNNTTLRKKVESIMTSMGLSTGQSKSNGFSGRQLGGSSSSKPAHTATESKMSMADVEKELQ